MTPPPPTLSMSHRHHRHLRHNINLRSSENISASFTNKSPQGLTSPKKSGLFWNRKLCIYMPVDIQA